MAYCVFRFRHRDGRQALYRPENKTPGSGGLRGDYRVGASPRYAVAPGLVVWHQFITVPSNATGLSKSWVRNGSLRSLGARQGRKLGTSDTRNVSPDNPLGLNPNDPNGQDDVVVVSDDLHLPVGKPVKVLLRATDVVSLRRRPPCVEWGWAKTL